MRARLYIVVSASYPKLSTTAINVQSGRAQIFKYSICNLHFL
jgi:hypothetical protein